MKLSQAIFSAVAAVAFTSGIYAQDPVGEDSVSVSVRSMTEFLEKQQAAEELVLQSADTAGKFVVGYSGKDCHIDVTDMDNGTVEVQFGLYASLAMSAAPRVSKATVEKFNSLENVGNHKARMDNRNNVYVYQTIRNLGQVESIYAGFYSYLVELLKAGEQYQTLKEKTRSEMKETAHEETVQALLNKARSAYMDEDWDAVFSNLDSVTEMEPDNSEAAQMLEKVRPIFRRGL